MKNTSLYGPKPEHISNEMWDTLTDKQKDYITLLYARKYTKIKIMRKLYITTDSGFWKMQKIVRKKIEEDIKRMDSVHKKKK